MFDDKSVLSARDAALTVGNDMATPDPYGLDMNGDRHPDILWQDSTSGENTLWYMGGQKGSEYRASVTIDPMSGEWKIKSALDFDLDGNQDLLWRNEKTGQNEVWFMGGDKGRDRLSTQEISGIGSDWEMAGGADFNQDGRGDLLWRNKATGKNEVWFMGGARGIDVKSTGAIRTLDKNWEVGGIADFDQDGHADIVWRHNQQGKNAIWLLDGDKGTHLKDGKELNNVGGAWKMKGAADFNQDGTPDIFWHNGSTGKSAIWYMTGATGSQIKDGDVMSWTDKTRTPLVAGWGSLETAVKPVSSPPILPSVEVPKAEPENPPENPLVEQTAENGKFDIQFDYRFDNLNWFDSQKRAVLEAAADIWESIIQDDFKAVKAGTTVHASNPITGGIEAFQLDYDIDDIVVFAFANNMGGAGGKLAEAGATTYQGDRNTTTVFQPWLGEIEFDISEPWYINADPSETVNVPDTQPDFLSVAVHELGHILGISASLPAFRSLINSKGEFTGEAATAINNGQPIPLDAVGSHIKDGFEIPGLGENALDPQIKKGDRKLLTILDVALLDDIGYTIDYSSLKPVPKVDALAVVKDGQTVTKLQVGERYELQWDDNFSGAVKIDLYEGSKFVQTIDSATPSDGSFGWRAPAELANSDRFYRFKVSSVEDKGIYSFSDRPFTIQAKSFISGSTFNDATLKIGNQYNLVWDDNLSETIKIELYKGDQFVRTLTASTMSDGSYQWRVPSFTAKGNDYRLKLTSRNDVSIYDFSPVFTIHD